MLFFFKLQLYHIISLDQVEKVELRRFFSDVCGVHKVKSSKLWQTLAGDRSKKRTLHTFAFNSQLAKCHSLEGKVIQ